MPDTLALAAGNITCPKIYFINSLRYAACPSWQSAHQLFLHTIHQVHSSLPDKQQHTVALHESPDTRYICWE